jgi:hypothetical protein
VVFAVSVGVSVGGDFVDGDAGAGEIDDGFAVGVGGE